MYVCTYIVDFHIVVSPAFLYLIKYFPAVCVVSGVVSLADVTLLCVFHYREEKGNLLGTLQAFHSQKQTAWFTVTGDGLC